MVASKGGAEQSKSGDSLLEKEIQIQEETLGPLNETGRQASRSEVHRIDK